MNAQIAVSCIDLVTTEQWFREGLGLTPAGGARLKTGRAFADDVLASPGAEAICWWMIAANPRFRIALLQFSMPLPRLQPADLRACDIGYTRIGVHVFDFDTVLGNLARLGSTPVGPVLDEQGARRACVRSPDGVFVEIMERDPLADAPRVDRERPVAVRSLTVSTPDLAASIAYFSALTGRAPDDVGLHEDSHEALWGLAGASCRRAVLRSGDVLIELAEYADPIGRPRPGDYRVSDQGILEVSFRARTADEHEAGCRRLRNQGARLAQTNVRTPVKRAVYVKDPLGFPAELLWIQEGVHRGLRPMPIGRRPRPARHRVQVSVRIDAPLDAVWAALNDHRRMDRWIGADAFQVTKHGTPDSAGYGAERLLTTQGRNVLQQVTRVIPGHIGYRAIAGTPFSYHNGTVDVRASENGTQLDWTIRFRTQSRALGAVVYSQLQGAIAGMLDDLKAMVEAQGGKPTVMRSAASDSRGMQGDEVFQD